MKLDHGTSQWKYTIAPTPVVCVGFQWGWVLKDQEKWRNKTRKYKRLLPLPIREANLVEFLSVFHRLPGAISAAVE